MSEMPKDNQAGGCGSVSVDCSKRQLLVATSVVGGVGVALTAVPFLSMFAPSERAKAAGAPVEVDISTIKAGEMGTVEWRGKPVWILRRTPEMVSSLNKTQNHLLDPNSERKPDELTPKYCRNQHRSIKPELLVAVGICSHLGCSPISKFQPGPQPSLPGDWAGGFLCPCHGSTFDLAGRVYKNKPASDNLEIPPHRFLSDTKVVIGEETA
jgi:ubiquinol-cytochrome c reductase iron-sulfur subunit